MEKCSACDKQFTEEFAGLKKISFGAHLEDCEITVNDGLRDVFPIQLTPVKPGRGQSKR